MNDAWTDFVFVSMSARLSLTGSARFTNPSDPSSKPPSFLFSVNITDNKSGHLPAYLGYSFLHKVSNFAAV